MIFVPGGNILKCPAQTLVCPVNTVGVMGCGLAKAFASVFKGLLYHYRVACRTEVLRTDTLWVWSADPNKQVLCFPTKEDWKNPSEVGWIIHGMRRLVAQYQALGITSIAIPMLGCGAGQLTWEQIGPIVVEYARQLPMDVYIFGVEPKEEIEDIVPLP